MSRADAFSLLMWLVVACTALRFPCEPWAMLLARVTCVRMQRLEAM